jgi:diguanylate cyclase (GGDEF)-like protein/PAS domain S-box-containing protein
MSGGTTDQPWQGPVDHTGVARVSHPGPERERDNCLATSDAGPGFARTQLAARALASLPGTAVLVYDRRLRCLLAAGEAPALLGCDPDLIVGRAAAEALPADLYGRLEPLLRSALRGQTDEVEDVGPVDGDARYRVEVAPVSAEDGEVIGAMAICRNVTMERFEVTFGEAPIGMALVGLDGRWLRVNRALCEITGYDEAELLGLTFQEITHPDDLDADLGLLGELIVGNRRHYSIEKRFFGKGGDEAWVNVSVSLVHDADGVPEYFISQIEDISGRKRMQEQLVTLTERDDLTGLLNRRRFERELEQQFERCRRYGERAAVMMVDLDNFKYVNDAFGHSAGDRLLETVAGAIRGCSRNSDHVARIGGDEFAIVAAHVTPAAALELAERLTDVVRNHPVTFGGRTIHTTASIGVCPIDARAESAEAALVAADAAMYDAKAAGRNRAVLLGQADGGRHGASAGIQWSTTLRRAIDGDGLVLLTQPLVPVDGGSPEWHEVLLRLRDEDCTLVTPAAFVYHAERFGLMAEIDRWVIRQACRLLASDAYGPAGLSVNLGAQSVSDPGLLDYIESEIADAGIGGERLMFELTETEALAHLERAKRLARGLRRLGCSIALDDFATGFGSLSYVKSLPFDVIKIDGDFIRNLAENRADQLIVRAVVDIAHGLGKRTVAEYVADRETLELVRDAGVDLAQGFYVGRPGPAPQLLVTY